MPLTPLPPDAALSPPPPAASLFASIRWRQVLDATYDLSFYQAVLPEDEARDGYAPALPVATFNRDLAPRVVGLPFSDYLDTDGCDVSSFRTLINEVRAAFPARPLVVKTTFPHDTEGLGAVDRRAVRHRVPTPSHEGVDEAMRSSFQRNVRQARRAGVSTTRAQSLEAVGTFYDLHRRLRFGKFNKIPQPRRFFDAIHDAFFATDNGFVLQALRNDTVIGSLVVLRHRDVLYYKFGASAREALEHRPNNLLFYDLLHYAVDAGAVAVDLGLSGAGPSYEGLRFFKESFGGQPSPVTCFRTNPPGYDDSAEQELNDLLGAVTHAVAEHNLGADATDDISQALYPYFA
jgi:hypothetical protein